MTRVSITDSGKVVVVEVLVVEVLVVEVLVVEVLVVDDVDVDVDDGAMVPDVDGDAVTDVDGAEVAVVAPATFVEPLSGLHAAVAIAAATSAPRS